MAAYNRYKRSFEIAYNEALFLITPLASTRGNLYLCLSLESYIINLNINQIHAPWSVKCGSMHLFSVFLFWSVKYLGTPEGSPIGAPIGLPYLLGQPGPTKCKG